jgi:hypothetical protein
VLTGIAHDRHLTDHEKLICDPALKFSILGSVGGRNPLLVICTVNV